MGNTTGELDVLNSPGDLSLRVGDHLAVLGGDQRSDVVAVAVEQIAKAEQDRRSLRERRSAPLAEGTGSGFDRLAWLREAYRDAIEMRFEGDLPRAGAVARLAARRFARGAGIAAAQASPLYLRDKVALTTEERRARQ